MAKYVIKYQFSFEAHGLIVFFNKNRLEKIKGIIYGILC